MTVCIERRYWIGCKVVGITTLWNGYLIALEESMTPGGIYNEPDGAPHTRPTLLAGWNSVKVVLDEPVDGNGLETTVFINGQQVTRFLSSDNERGHGGIALQAYMATEVHFKNLRWRKIPESGN